MPAVPRPPNPLRKPDVKNNRVKIKTKPMTWTLPHLGIWQHCSVSRVVRRVFETLHFPSFQTPNEPFALSQRASRLPRYQALPGHAAGKRSSVRPAASPLSRHGILILRSPPAVSRLSSSPVPHLRPCDLWIQAVVIVSEALLCVRFSQP